MNVRRGVSVLGLLTLAAAGVAACSSSSGGSGSGVALVASTDVWGDVAKQVAGSVKGVQITSVITDPAADPHSYESDARTALAVKRADVIVENGGGYDDFMDTLRTSYNTDAAVLNAVTISGHKAAVDGDLNEHVWYDFPTVITVADRIAAALGKADDGDASAFKANAAAFDKRVQALEATEAGLKAKYAGKGVAITEPVPLYLLQACGLVNRTPAKFSEAIEEGTDVSVAVLNQTEQLFRSRSVALLAYNEQTSGAETEQVLSVARQNHVPVVPVTETLPKGDTYLSWMAKNLAAVGTALGSATGK